VKKAATQAMHCSTDRKNEESHIGALNNDSPSFRLKRTLAMLKRIGGNCGALDDAEND
jgi:hypothetical protein